MSYRDAQESILARYLADAQLRTGLAEDEHRGDDAPPLHRYKGRPLDFLREQMGLTTRSGKLSMWAAQRSIVSSVWDHPKTLARGARKWGKTFTFAAIAHAWLQTDYGKVIVLGPGLDQVRDVFWAAFEEMWLAAPSTELLGTCGKLRAEIAPGRSIVAIPTKSTPGRARGYHGGVRIPDDPDEFDPEAIEQFEAEVEAAGQDTTAKLLVLIDEGQEIAREVYRILQGTISSKAVHVAIATNPMLGMSDIHEVAYAARADSGYHRIAVSHVSEERIVQMGGVRDPLDADERFEAVPPYFVDEGWVEEMLRRHDIHDPLLWSDVFGRLSEGNLSQLVIPRSALLAALDRDPRNQGLPPFEGPSIGVDIGLTRDKCVAVFLMDGEMVDCESWLPGATDNQAQVSIADRIIELARKWGAALNAVRAIEWENVPIPGHRIHVDDSGMTAVADIMASKGVTVDRVDFGGAPAGDWSEYMGDTEFVNRKAELFWALRRLLQEGAVRVAPKWERIWEQAQWIEFERKTRAKGAYVQIQSKDEVRKAFGRSPDDLDALALAACEPRTGRVFSGGGSGRTFG